MKCIFFMRYISYIVYALSELLKWKHLLTAVYFILNCKILTHQLTPPAEVEEAGGVTFNAKLLKYMTHTHTYAHTRIMRMPLSIYKLIN